MSDYPTDRLRAHAMRLEARRPKAAADLIEAARRLTRYQHCTARLIANGTPDDSLPNSSGLFYDNAKSEIQELNALK